MSPTATAAKKRLLTALVFAGAVLAVGLMMVLYLRFAQAEEQENVARMVHESATQSVALIQERLSADMAYIEQIGLFLGRSSIPIDAPETLRSLQGNEEIKQTFKCITTAAPDGTVYDVDGSVLGNISGHAHFQAAMGGETTISNMEQTLDDHKRAIFVTAPIVRDGRVIGIVDGRFLMSSLTKVLSAELLDGRGYNYMSSADGQLFVWPDNPRADHDLHNIYQVLQQSSSVSRQAQEDMRRSMLSGQSGRISYRWHGEMRTMSYLPVGINDWYLISVLPNEIVTSRAREITQRAFLFTAALLVILLLLVFYMGHARRRDQRALAAVHKELLTIYNTIPGGVFKCRLDEGFTLVAANAGFYHFFGCTKECLQAQHQNQLAHLLPPEEAAALHQSVADQLRLGSSIRSEIRVVAECVKWLLVCGDVTTSDRGEALLYCCFTDISELKHAQQALRDANQRYEIIMEKTQDVLFEWNLIDGTVQHSKIFERKFGYPCTLEHFPESVLQAQLIHPQDEVHFLALYRRIAQGERFSTEELRVQKADGSFLWCRISVTAVLDEGGRLCRAVGIITDIDRVKQELTAVTAQAQRDSMTGLYNKAATCQMITQRLEAPGAQGALLVVDVDNFKAINDTFGHASGDTVLLELSSQLSRLFRASDIVGRVGGDEFVVFFDGLGEGDVLTKKLDDVSSAFRWSFRKGGLDYFVSCSIGVALMPRDGQSYAALFERADAALYYAKQHGKQQYALYRGSMEAAIHGAGAEDCPPP